MDKPTQILVEARALLLKGWIQGSFSKSYLPPVHKPHRCFCAIGAIHRACELVRGGEHHRREAIAHVAFTLEPTLGALLVCESMLISYNDQPGRTQDEVVDLFTRTIEARKKGR